MAPNSYTFIQIIFLFTLATIHSRYVLIKILRQEKIEISFDPHEPKNLTAGPVPIHICDRKATDQFVQNIKFSLTPNPIEIEPGKTITLDFSVDLLKEIPKGSTISLKLKKHEFIDFTIPCLHVGAPVPVGSCTYDIQQLLDLAKQHIKDDCYKYFPANGCQLPIAVGQYGTVRPLQIKLPGHFSIPNIVKIYEWWD